MLNKKILISKGSENMEKTTYQPDGLKELEEFAIDLLKTNTNSNHPFATQVLNNFIVKIDIIIKKLKQTHRLPLHQIEKEIIEICKKDNSTHGVVVRFLFTTKYSEIDTSRLSYLNVKL